MFDAEIQRDCTNVMLSFNMNLDAMNFAAVSDLFTDDAFWKSVSGPLHGRKEIDAHLARYPRQKMLHFCSNIVVDVQDQDHAVTSAYFMFFGNRQEPFTNVKFVGTLKQKQVRTADGWKIAEHLTEIFFRDTQYTMPTDAPVPALAE